MILATDIQRVPYLVPKWSGGNSPSFAFPVLPSQRFQDEAEVALPQHVRFVQAANTLSASVTDWDCLFT